MSSRSCSSRSRSRASWPAIEPQGVLNRLLPELTVVGELVAKQIDLRKGQHPVVDPGPDHARKLVHGDAHDLAEGTVRRVAVDRQAEDIEAVWRIVQIEVVQQRYRGDGSAPSRQ